jgi:transcriptional regulator GlxA family with amidase domain
MFAPGDVHSLEISGNGWVVRGQSQRWPTAYELCVVAATKDPIRCASGLRIVPDRAIGDFSPMPDTFVVVAGYGVPDRPSSR